MDLIDVTRPVVTRNGIPAKFYTREYHRLYPLTFIVEGKYLSFSIWGERDIRGETPCDLFNTDDAEVFWVQLELEL
jgi:hypothetical protein